MIYLDHNASNPAAPEILEAVVGVLRSAPGNPGSPHGVGRRARAIVEGAREHVAEAFGFRRGQVVFCASGTEALNLVLTGLLDPGDHFLHSAVEHKAVYEPACALEQAGVMRSVLPVDAGGRIKLDAVPELILPETTLCAVMAANNEVGTLQPLEELRALLPPRVRLLVDGIQAAGRIELDWSLADALVISGHKLRAPKGSAALLLRDGLEPRPLIRGGSQERGRRGGTEAVAAIAGLGCAARLVKEGTLFSRGVLQAQREQFESALMEALPMAEILGLGVPRLPQTTALVIPGWTAEELIAALDLKGVAVSSGSACSSGSLLASHVLLAMGLSESLARSALRISFGPETSSSELDRALAILATIVG